MLRILLAGFHLLALGLGLGAVLTLVIVLMVFAAVTMARGYGLVAGD